MIAERQSAGRGRLGRRWTSPAGKGLLFSVVLRPRLPMSGGPPAHARRRDRRGRGASRRRPGSRSTSSGPTTSSSATRRSAASCMEVAGEQDEVDWVVVGIGINVNTEFIELPVALRRTATSLKMRRREHVDRSDAACRLLLSLETHYPTRAAGGFEKPITALPRTGLPAERERERGNPGGSRHRRGCRHRRTRRAARGASPPPHSPLPLRRRDAPL